MLADIIALGESSCEELPCSPKGKEAICGKSNKMIRAFQIIMATFLSRF